MVWLISGMSQRRALQLSVMSYGEKWRGRSAKKSGFELPPASDSVDLTGRGELRFEARLLAAVRRLNALSAWAAAEN